MKTLLYMFRRYRMATVLNLLGLGVAIATFYLFMTQVIYNRTYNHNIVDHERVFRLEYTTSQSNGWDIGLCRPFLGMVNDLPHVKGATYNNPYQNSDITVKVNNREIAVRSMTMHRPGIEFFTGRLLYGSAKEASQRTGNVVVSRSVALKMFGTDKAVGRTFIVPSNDGEQQFTVVGVSEDMPDNCTIGNAIYFYETDEGMNDTSEWSYAIFVKLDDAANAAKVARALKKEAMKSWGVSNEKDYDRYGGPRFRLTSMDDVYFSGVGPMDKGNRNLVAVLTVASVFILVIALLNLLNFTLSEIPMRIRGINTRRVMGASVGSLRLKLVMENVAVAAVGLVLAVLTIVSFGRSETCMRLVSGDIGFASHALLATAMAVAALAVGALSAVMPAWYSTSFAPAMVLKGSFGLSPRGRRLRMAIMAVQFCVAFALAIYIGVMVCQSRYIFNSDYGFAKNEVFYTYLTQEAKQKKDAIRAELQKLPFVKAVGFAQNAIGAGDVYMGWGRGDGDRRMKFSVVPCDDGYLRTMGLHVAEGRDFRESDMKTGAYIVNRTMMKKYDWLVLGDSIGRQNPWGEGNYPIVGVCDNFKLMSMRNDNSSVAMAFLVMGPDMASWGDRGNMLFVRVAEEQDKLAAKQRITGIVNGIDPTGDYTMSFLDDDLQRTYVDEFRFISQVKLFAFICILITVIGVFSLTMFETEYRRKEIALRKVMGSTVGGVVMLFVRRYTIPLVLSFAVAAPLGWWLGTKWLQSFAEHTPMHWWLLPLAFVGVAAVVLLTVAAQSWRVATENPVESIKTE